ncbi:ABC transporter ATP-binding protein [Micromonospora sp. HNM0581]|uniref:ABC transporter ATP-binding protein n=1 Tax=Micromonospora sp. HNM0581 TaxID=2716341 RepID=UPI00146A6875|nr:ATP-binding cassette domain-containing protein [Micromonospora sp. HNM0581]NLU79138.1 ABC transporter ATP-binding protein [Micromonospora sp. HNM0581]
MTVIVEVRGLTVTAADGTAVLNAVDLDVVRGRVTGLVGPSGSGKTTLALCLLGHLGRGLRRTAGAVEVAGADPFLPAVRRRLRGRVTGYLPQDPLGALDPRRSVAAQLGTAARIARPQEDRAARRARVEQAAHDAALDLALLRRYPGQLSGGQAQRAVLAWTLVTQPELIVLDEPTSGLDAGTAYRIGRRFSTLPWQPAVLMISHDVALVDDVADVTHSMRNGRLSIAGRGIGAPMASAPARRSATGDRMTALSFEDVTVRHGPLCILRNVSGRVGAGEMVGIRGASGSGKTSLARALCGLAPPATGRLLVRGMPVSWDAVARVRAGEPYVAYVGQDARAALNPRETVRRAIARSLVAAARQGRARATWSVEEIAERFALAPELLDRTPDRLSGGQRHRAALARAVAAVPTALVCDESTASLDRDTESRVLDSLDGLRRDGTAVLLITHSDRVATRTDRILTIHQGHLR